MNGARLEDHSRRFDEMIGRLRDQDGVLRNQGVELQKVRESLARVEGFLMGSTDFRLRGPGTSDDEPSAC